MACILPTMKEEQDIYILVDRVLSGRASLAERQKVEEWRRVPANELVFMELEEMHQLTTGHPEVGEEQTQAALQSFRDRVSEEASMAPVRKFPWGRIAFGGVAAAAVILLLLWFQPWSRSGNDLYPEGWTVSTERGETKRFDLADGSQVHLNARSELKVLPGFGEEARQVELKGEAFFEVARDEDHPFSIMTRGVQTTVLGTSFNVRAYPGEELDKIAVKSGKVRVDAHEDLNWVIEPGQSVETDTESGSQTKITGDPFSWIENRWVYDAAPLYALVTDLENRFDRQFEIEEGLEELQFSASFETQSLTEILEVITLTIGLQYTDSAQTVHIFSREDQP